jgi:hypothetical protein
LDYSSNYENFYSNLLVAAPRTQKGALIIERGRRGLALVVPQDIQARV